MGGGESLSSEKSRICPSCRMEISVLAVKCRFCGEEVGKPKEEQRTLSINDLGGEAISHRAPSGSVMEALEAFRVESDLEISQVGDNDSGGEDAAQIGSDGMPVLESDPFDTSFDSSKPSAITSVYEVTPPTLQDRMKTIAFVVGGIAILAFLGVKAPGWIDQIRGSDAGAVVPTYVNRAPGMLERGDPPIDALAAAKEAINHEDSAKNSKIASQAVAKLVVQVNGLLDKVPFKESNLREASTLATSALDIYAADEIVQLVGVITDESRAYKITLIAIDRETKTATFQPNSPSAKRMPVAKGDLLAGRFFVTLVGTRHVTVEDKQRGNRRVRFGYGGIED